MRANKTITVAYSLSINANSFYAHVIVGPT